MAKGTAIQTPRVEEIEHAAKQLALDAEIVPAKSRPPTWWEKTGYVILPRKDAKTELFRSLTSEIRKARSAKTAHDEHR